MKKILLITIVIFHSLCIFSQEERVSIRVEDQPLKYALELLEKESGYTFIYSSNHIDVQQKVTVYANNQTLKTILDDVCEKANISYSVENKQILLTSRAEVPTQNSVGETIISGQIKDNNNEAVIGASIHLKNDRTIGTTTDIDGNFSLKIPRSANSGDELLISYVGMGTTTLKLDGKNNYVVVMDYNEKMLKDVMVTGYQTISRERSAGSYVRVDSDILEQKPVINISSALNGLTPGLATTTDSDGRNRFLIRGQGTINDDVDKTDMDPLIVVDGFVIQGFSTRGVGEMHERDPFSSINPNDVESITVLKDAAATSIYGARAANGVIVITTKKGKGKKLSINFDAFLSVSSKPDLDYVADLPSSAASIWYIENLEKYSDMYSNSSYNPYADPTNPFVYMSRGAQLVYEYKRRNSMTESEYNAGIQNLLSQDGKWVNDLKKHAYRNQINQQYNLNLQGSSERNRYSLSVLFDKESGYSKGDDKNRVILNISNTFEIIKNLSLQAGANVEFERNNKNGLKFSDLQQGLSPWSRFVGDNGDYIHFPTNSTTHKLINDSFYGETIPTMYEPILASQYDDIAPVSWRYNPIADRDRRSNTSKIFSSRFYGSIDYKIFDGLSASLKGQYERNAWDNNHIEKADSYLLRHYTNKYSSKNPSIDKYESSFPKGGMLIDRSDVYTSYNVRLQLDYNKSFGKHDIVSILGGEVLSSSTERRPTYYRYGYNENTNSLQTTPDYFSQVETIFGINERYPYQALGGLRATEDRFISAYINAAYTYDQKYTFTASARTDASNFVSESTRNKFSPFWSVGATWNMAREKFIEDIGFINQLQLRASYGIAGVAAGKKSVSTLTTVAVRPPSVIHSNGEPINVISVRGNPDLTWEKSRTLNLGLNFSLFNRRLYGTFDFYNRLSYDVLASATVPYISQSVSTAVYNNAEIQNRGIELMIGSDQKITNDISWSGNVNLSFNKNTLKEYNAIPTRAFSNYVKGKPLNGVYGYELVGYTPEGFLKLEGKNDGKIEIVNSRATTHLYDTFNGAAGDTFDSQNWARFYGTSTPKVYAGFNNSFRIKNFTFSFQMTGKFGYYFNHGFQTPASAHNSPNLGSALDEAVALAKSGYREDIPVTAIPLYTEENKDVYRAGGAYMYMRNLYNQSNAVISKGDHIRLNEIYLGYDLPDRVFANNNFFKGLRVYCQARNLGLIWKANDRGIDPDYVGYDTILARNALMMKEPTFWTFGIRLKMK